MLLDGTSASALIILPLAVTFHVVPQTPPPTGPAATPMPTAKAPGVSRLVPRDKAAVRTAAFGHLSTITAPRAELDPAAARALESTTVALQEYTREVTGIKNTMQSQRALLSFLEKWGLSRMGSHRTLWAVARLALATAEKVGGMEDHVLEFQMDIGNI
ncbi:hypothetical protein VTJ04DRAFT_5838 [Mycothermus thermophilus]|uniref:uncharacterized protein n=1 Tax=Humicola insolens TaxID=85995 RepID=UPI0037444943